MKGKLTGKGFALIAVVLMIATVALFTVDTASFGETGTKTKTKKEISEKAKGIQPAAHAEDKEMVYVLQKPDGKEYERIVSADGELHYEGYEDAVLPIDMKVTYLLDDEPVKPEDLPGEKGHLQIMFEYKNKLEAGNVHVPLLALTAVVLDNEKFSHIEVSPGRIMDDGNRTIALGFCLPGMSDSLGLSPEESGLYDMMSIECETEDYEINEIYTIVTDDLFKNLKMDNAGDLQELASELSGLEDGASKLTEGTGQLAAGSAKLANGMGKLTDAAESIDDGADKIDSGVGKIKKQMPTLTKGTAKLQKGAKQVYDGNTELASSLKKMYGSSPSKSSQGSGTLALRAGTKQIAAGTKELSDKVEKAAADIEKYNTEHNITLADIKAMTEDAENQVEQLMTTDVPGTAQQLQKGIEQQWKAYDDATDPGDKEEAKKKINELNQQLGQVKSVGETQQKIAKLADAIKELKQAYDSLDPDKFEKAVAKLDETRKNIKALSDGAAQVDSGVAELNVALAGKDGKGEGTDNLIGAAKTLSDGSSQVYDGILSLAGGSKKLAKGVKKLSKGTGALSQGTGAFLDGQNTAYKGMITLASGAGELDRAINQTIYQLQSRLATLPGDKITAVMNNIGPIQQAAEGYKGFGGKRTYESVTFIYKMDKVSK